VRRPDRADGMLVLANVLWSLNYATTKYAFERWNPLAFSGVRFTAAGLAMAAIVLRLEGSLRIARADVPRVVLAGATGIFLNQLTFNYALDYTAAANVALILGAAPAFTAAFVVALGHERVRPLHWLALGVSLCGVALVVQGGSGLAGFSLAGDLLAIGAALTWAAYSVMLRPLFGRYSAMRLSTLMILVGAVLMAPFAAVQLADQHFAGLGTLRWGALAYSAIFPLVVTNVLYFGALRRVGAARATLFMYLQPFLGALFAAILLGERIVALQLFGGVFVVGGVALGRLGRLRTRAEPGLAGEMEPPAEPS
jgi:drug/metabolite transporter (DMT)-like permease